MAPTTDKALYAITAEAEDLDEMVERVSSFIAEYWVPKWKFSPRPDSTIRKIGFNDYLTGIEFLLSAFLVPNYQPDESLRAKVSTIFQNMGGTSPLPPTTEETQPWLPIFQKALSLPQLRDAVFNASEDAWVQARTDYQTLCRWLRTVTELSLPKTLNLLTDPNMQEFRDRFFLLGASTWFLSCSLPGIMTMVVGLTKQLPGLMSAFPSSMIPRPEKNFLSTLLNTCSNRHKATRGR